MSTNKNSLFFVDVENKRGEVIKKIQTLCASLLLNGVSNVVYAANQVDYLQLKSVETEVEADATKKH